MQITPFGITKNGETVRAYTLRCGKNSATLLDRGATLNALCIAGTDVVLGFDSIGAYERNDAYLGAVIGRYANRIADGFTLGGIYYPLAANDTDHGVHLHGGPDGFDRKIFCAEPYAALDGAGEGIRFTLLSEDMDQGYPGNLSLCVSYFLDAQGLMIRYEARCDRDTPLNLTNHSYFCLDGKNITTHTLQLFAGTYAKTDARLIVTNPRVSVAGTPLDFRSETSLAEALAAQSPVFEFAGGIDHNFNLDKTAPGQPCGDATLFPAAVLRAGQRSMTVLTDFPCMQVYTANFLHGEDPMKNGCLPSRHAAICFETQEAGADAPNRGEAVLRAGTPYCRTAKFLFAGFDA